MSWSIRDATEDDRPALRRFECDSGADCPSCGPDGGNAHELEIEEYLRRLALNEAALKAPHNEHALLVLTDESDLLAGAVAYERAELRVKGGEVDALRIVVAGLRVDTQGEEVSGARLSSHLIAAAVRGYSVTPPLVIARAAECNQRSLSLLRRHAFDLELVQTDAGWVDLAGRAEDVITTLPAPLDN
jgi:hypothetical protein